MKGKNCVVADVKCVCRRVHTVTDDFSIKCKCGATVGIERLETGDYVPFVEGDYPPGNRIPKIVGRIEPGRWE